MNDLMLLSPIVSVGLLVGWVMFRRKVTADRKQQHRTQVLQRLNLLN